MCGYIKCVDTLNVWIYEMCGYIKCVDALNVWIH